MKQVIAAVFVVLGFAGQVQAQGALDVEQIYLGTYGGTICRISSGSGSPNGVLTGSVCDYYIDTVTSNLYRKLTGTATNTGWDVVPMTNLTNTWTALQTFSAGLSSTTGAFSGAVGTGALTSTTGTFSNTVTINVPNGSRGLQITAGTAPAGSMIFVADNTGTARFRIDNGFGLAVRTASNTDVFTVASATGNTVVSGTLGVTGDATASATLNVLGALKLGSASTAILQSPSADIIEMYRTTNPQRMNWFNTRASASDCEYGYNWWNSNIYRLGTTKCASGTNRDMQFEPGAVSALSLSATTQTATFTKDILPTSNFSGMIGNSAARFSLLYAGELVVQTIIAQATQATIGGRIVVAPTNLLTAALAGIGTTITVKYNNLVNGDRIYMEAGGNVEWMAVTSSAGGSAGAYTYSVTRNLDGTGANDWVAGDAVLDTGTTGNGYTDIFSTAGILSGTGPTIIGNVRTGTTYSQVAPRWAIGNLKSIYNYSASDIYGAAFGDASATNVTIDATNGFRIRNSTTDKFKADTSGNLSLTGDLAMSTSGVFRAGATAFTTTTGWWLDYNAGTPRFRIGNPSGNMVKWDGTDLTVVSANVTIDSTGITLGGLGSGFSSGSAYRFTRPTGLGFGQAGDIQSMWAESSAGLDRIFIQNKVVGNGTSYGTSNVVLSAFGWDRIGLVNFGEANITLESSQTRVRVLTTAAIIEMSATTDVRVTSAIFKVNNAAADLQVTNGTTNMSLQPGFFGTTSNHAWVVLTNNGTNATFCAAGGLTVGSPTGGCKGAGTINVTAAYDDNVLLTDWVFELAYDQRPANGETPWPPTARRLYTLPEVRAMTEAEHRLPWMPKASEFDVQRHTGGMITRLYQGQEQQQLYLFDLEARLAALEQLVRRQ